MTESMYIARSSDEEMVKKAEHGGAVSSLLKFALESGRVDSILAVKARDGDRFDGEPALITKPEELMETAGSLHFSSPNIARFIKEYLDGASNSKTAVVVKPCDAKAIIELAKRNQIDLDNLLLIGVNCTGTLPPARSKKMLVDEFEVNPASVVAEDIEDNKLIIILKDGTEKERDLAKLEEQGYGRRDNCRRCETNIPTMADIACGKWGTTDKNTTFVQVCSEKGADLVEAAIQGGVIKAKQPSAANIEARKNKDEAARELARQCRDKDFAELEGATTEERFNYWNEQFSRCIKCYGCRDACPICYCKSCMLEADRGFVDPGEVPPNAIFPMVRITHVMNSCVNCGQCQDACAMEIPLSRLIFLLSIKLGDIFHYEPGMDVNVPPPMATVPDEEMSLPDVEVAL